MKNCFTGLSMISSVVISTDADSSTCWKFPSLMMGMEEGIHSFTIAVTASFSSSINLSYRTTAVISICMRWMVCSVSAGLYQRGPRPMPSTAFLFLVTGRMVSTKSFSRASSSLMMRSPSASSCSSRAILRSHSQVFCQPTGYTSRTEGVPNFSSHSAAVFSRPPWVCPA